MERVTIRMSRPMIAALAAHAKARGLDFSAYVRTQLSFDLERPHDIHMKKKEATR